MKFLKNTLIVLLCLLLFAAGLYLLIYKSYFSLTYVSNILFIVGVLVFLPALSIHLGAYRMFYSFSYFAKSVLNKEFKKNYPSFVDYRDEKDVENDKSFSLIIVAASGFVLAASIIISILVL